VGLTFHKKIGDRVKEGEPILTIHHNENQKDLVLKMANDLLKRDLSFSNTKPEKLPSLIYETQTSWY
jgi:pyrimidine-nucleoside phosphorylase